MPRVFITAFEPYDHWQENASWLALVEFTKEPVQDAEIKTRLYPVDFHEVRRRLESDLAEDYDYVLHMGQAPGSASVQLEAIALNIGGSSHQPPEKYRTLVDSGPVAYQSELPLREWVHELRQAGVPASVSFHAGMYLCNATLYFTHYLIEKLELKSRATFLHLPLATEQVAPSSAVTASLPSSISAKALRVIVQQLATPAPARDEELA